MQIQSMLALLLGLSILDSCVITCGGADGAPSWHPHHHRAHEVKLDEGSSNDASWATCSKCTTCNPTVPVIVPTPTSPILAQVPNAPAIPDVEPKNECAECGGCNVRLRRLSERVPFEDNDAKVFLGASGAAVLLADTAKGEEVVLKMWCGIQGEYHQSNGQKDPIPPTCKDQDYTDMEKCPDQHYGLGPCNFRLLASLDQLYRDANLTAVIPRSWTGPVIGTHPGPLPGSTNAKSDGVRISTMAQYFTLAKGVSVESVRGLATQKHKALAQSIKPLQVQQAAMADLLFSESDRHGQNVMIDEDGNINLIDNEGAFGPTNSMFLPGGQKFEVYRIGYGAVCCGNTGKCPGQPQTRPAAENMFDYRCFVKDYKMGNNFPPGVKEFLEKIERMSPQAIHSEYQLNRRQYAELLKERVHWLLQFGFEETLNKVYARQPRGDGVKYGNNFSYPIHPPCCLKDGCDYRG